MSPSSKSSALTATVILVKKGSAARSLAPWQPYADRSGDGGCGRQIRNSLKVESFLFSAKSVSRIPHILDSFDAAQNINATTSR